VIARLALLRAASLALCLAGGALVAQGASVPVTAEIEQAKLDRAFEQTLRSAVRPVAGETMPSASGRTIVVSARLPLAPPVRAAKVAAGRPVARIAVRRLGVEQVIVAGSASHEQLAKGPAMIRQGDAESPVTVLAAHRDTHFLFIRDLREGDVMTMEHADGTVETYRVTWFQTVRWNEFTYPLDPPRPLLALTTCYPFGGTEYGGPWRRVAWAERIG